MAHPIVLLELSPSGITVAVNALNVDMIQARDANSAVIIISGVEYTVQGDYTTRLALIKAALHHLT
jgi:hypothetical protein